MSIVRGALVTHGYMDLPGNPCEICEFIQECHEWHAKDLKAIQAVHIMIFT